MLRRLFGPELVCALAGFFLVVIIWQGVRSDSEDAPEDNAEASSDPRVERELEAVVALTFPTLSQARSVKAEQMPPWTQADVIEEQSEYEAIRRSVRQLSPERQRSLLAKLRKQARP